MRLIKIENLRGNDRILRGINVVNGITFLGYEQRKFVLEAANNDLNIIKNWFTKIGICYDSIEIVKNNIYYTVGGETLSLPDLSSGERFLLYLMAGKAINANIVACGLFERLGGRLEAVALREFRNYENLTVVIYNALLLKAQKYFYGGN